MQILTSSESVEWFTPPHIINLTRMTMGGIDLDPATSHKAQTWIRAGQYYTKEDDGLSRLWYGRVFLNPPYGKSGGKSNQQIWAEKLIHEYQYGDVIEAVLLCKSVPGYKWFEEVWDRTTAICFVRELVHFIKADNSKNGPAKAGTAFFYFGPNAEKFNVFFGEIGRVFVNE